MTPVAHHILEANRLEFGYQPDQTILSQVDFKAPAEKLICVLGPNGSGKSTLMRCLMGQLTPRVGQIVLDQKPLSQYKPKELAQQLAYVPQNPSTTFSFSALELVLMGRFAHGGALGIISQKDIDIARAAMTMTHTDRFERRTLNELSGGEAQGVMIARALAQQPRIMLLDEPTSQLDIANQLMIYQMMRRLAHDWKLAVVCISHDLNLAARFADELVFMRSGQVVATGNCQDMLKQDILEQVYGIRIRLIDDPKHHLPFVIAESELPKHS